MKIDSINNQSFGARIKISKAATQDFRDASIISGLGASSSGFGASAMLPASEPIHHIHYLAKILDIGSAIGGATSSVVGGVFMKISNSLFKNGVKRSKMLS